ncbi:MULTISPECIES: PLP-dependent aminotransferase family protein [Rhodopseudomonas]|uniref:MocR-like pyridoxine biosynthesis transcription factor PdxR n=1 Tax=Rhodopseudomonas TaxID=1073 RepID=UPI0005C8AF42|nr:MULTISPECIES: PLP-dependent aminotransferase family protein [Rhodopseudomonas]MDF3812715.1 PLP-dependent aminotransferase family protein [Rhodopseudomonas sp. BAL398]WOK15778.1 PLP-dependent aminotransferase family protein [Rhodopseudomonas sp. BAL398]
MSSAERDRLMWKELLARAAKDGVQLQAQLRNALVDAIVDGNLPAGRRVPSSRNLAELAGVSRTTASIVLEKLTADRFLESRPRDGYYVSSALREQKLAIAQSPDSLDQPDWAARMAHADTRYPWQERPAGWQSCPYRFVYGEVNPQIFPFADWRDASRSALGKSAIQLWGQDSGGDESEELVKQIINKILPRRGIAAKPEQVMLTLGTQHGLYLIAQTLLRSGVKLALEEPGYMDARYIFMRSGAELLSVPLDAFGMTIDKRLAECNYLYCTPSHQSPTGVTMSTERRLGLLTHATRHDQIIIEDDYEPELKYEGAAAAALKAMDRSGRVVYLSSLSKLVCPGLRLGYIVGPERLMTELKSLRRLMIRQLPGNNLASAAQFIRQGHYDRLIGAMRQALELKAKIIMAILRKELPMVQMDAPTGGSAIWMRIPQLPNSDRLRAACFDAGVLIDPVEPYFANPPKETWLRLNFASIPQELVERGTLIFARTVRTLLRNGQPGR